MDAFSATVEETTTHESEQLCLPRRVHYPERYIECLVVVTGTLKEYVNACLGRTQGAAAVKLDIPCKSLAGKRRTCTLTYVMGRPQ